MSREIKFRAWDDKNKKMIYPTGYYGNDLHWRIEGSNNGFWGIFDGNKRLCGNADESGVLLQYTGLKDKNGKKIYEGDIVRCINLLTSFDGDVTYNILPSAPTFIGIVEFSDTAFCIKKIKNKLITYNLLHYYLEVIGNIYENPELLESEE